MVTVYKNYPWHELSLNYYYYISDYLRLSNSTSNYSKLVKHYLILPKIILSLEYLKLRYIFW